MNTYTSAAPCLRILLILLVLSSSVLTSASARTAVTGSSPVLLPESSGIVFIPRSVKTKLTEAQWKTYGERLSEALATEHPGLQEAALRMIVQYGPYLDMNRAAVYDVVRIYRGHENENLRRMAVVAISRMESGWGLDFLSRSLRFEKSPVVRQTLTAVLGEHPQR